MTREIKFRARARNGDWWYGSSSVDHLIHATNTMPLSMFWLWVEGGTLDSKTVGEYTGLKDKNGNEKGAWGIKANEAKWERTMEEINELKTSGRKEGEAMAVSVMVAEE